LLVGRYLQLGIFFHTILALPGAIIWSLLTEEAILWFDFDQETATAGQHYAYTLLVYIFLHGTHECLTEFLNTMDHENYATAFSLIAHACQSILILVLALSGVNDLVVVGLAQVAIGILEIIINLSIMTCNGWLDDYWDGLLRTNGLKVSMMVFMNIIFVAVIPLFGLLSTYALCYV
jgi:Na+-driven multidrug efflux pump